MQGLPPFHDDPKISVDDHRAESSSSPRASHREAVNTLTHQRKRGRPRLPLEGLRHLHEPCRRVRARRKKRRVAQRVHQVPALPKRPLSRSFPNEIARLVDDHLSHCGVQICLVREERRPARELEKLVRGVVVGVPLKGPNEPLSLRLRAAFTSHRARSWREPGFRGGPRADQPRERVGVLRRRACRCPSARQRHSQGMAHPSLGRGDTGLEEPRRRRPRADGIAVQPSVPTCLRQSPPSKISDATA